MNYRVTWIIDIEANNALDAAKKALEIQQDIDSIANVFTVVDDQNKKTFIDLGQSQ